MQKRLICVKYRGNDGKLLCQIVKIYLYRSQNNSKSVEQRLSGCLMCMAIHKKSKRKIHIEIKTNN